MLANCSDHLTTLTDTRESAGPTNGVLGTEVRSTTSASVSVTILSSTNSSELAFRSPSYLPVNFYILVQLFTSIAQPAFTTASINLLRFILIPPMSVAVTVKDP